MWGLRIQDLGCLLPVTAKGCSIFQKVPTSKHHFPYMIHAIFHSFESLTGHPPPFVGFLWKQLGMVHNFSISQQYKPTLSWTPPAPNMYNKQLFWQRDYV